MCSSVRVMQAIRVSVIIGVTCFDGVVFLLKPGPWNYYWLFVVGCWAVLNIYWAAASAKVMPTSINSGIWLFSLFEYLLYALPLSFVPILGLRLAPRCDLVQALGASICAFATAFAIWARRALSRNWNNNVIPKNSVALVQSGPYAIVRHPIYLGFILFAFGAILALLEVRALVFITDIVVFFRRLRPEEQLLREKYPAEYPDYERRVKRLLPFVW